MSESPLSHATVKDLTEHRGTIVRAIVFAESLRRGRQDMDYLTHQIESSRIMVEMIDARLYGALPND